MHLRVTRVARGRTTLDEAISTFEAASAPVRQAPGFAGAALLADREARILLVGSYWETREAMDASAARIPAAVAEWGVDLVDLQPYEVLHLERTQPLSSGTFVRIVTATMPADRIADAERDLLERLLPRARALEGFRSVVLGADRQSGRLLCASTWDSVAARAASDAEFTPDRDRLGETVGASSVSVENYEIAFASVGVAASATT